MSTMDMAVESFKLEKTCHVDEQPTKKGTPEAAAMDGAPDGCFDCNICLDFASDPVVTFCGHLFCWPCIYRWLQQVQRPGAPQTAERPCPVCKSTLSKDTLVPLYGRGHSGKGDDQGVQIPRRPVSAHRPSSEQHSPSNQHPPMQQHIQDHYYYPHFNAGAGGGYTMPPPPSSPLLGQTRVAHSVAGSILGDMALAVMPWLCRNQQWTDVYYSSPYHAASYVSSARLRRQEMAMGSLLHQIWLFLLFCATLCLLLF